jgi:hypothetical protein
MRFKQHLAGLLLGSCLLQTLWAADGVVANVNSVQAAFLYNFALFTEWPVLSVNQFNICVMASDPVLEALQPFKAKQVRGSPVTVTQIASASQVSSCQILFVGQAEHASIKSLSRQIGRTPVLVVAEENSFDPQNVTITLVPQEGRIAFKINHTSALASSLTISSKLLKLAQQVY